MATRAIGAASFPRVPHSSTALLGLVAVVLLVGSTASAGARDGPGSGEAGAAPGERRGSDTAPVDSLVLLRSHRDGAKLQHVAVESGGRLSVVSEIALPQGPWYGGLCLTSPCTCLVVGEQSGGNAVAYQWTIGSAKVLTIGQPSTKYNVENRYSQREYLVDSYSPVAGRAIVYHSMIHGGMAYPMLWRPGTECWEKIYEGHSELRKHLRLHAGFVEVAAAAYSPDGSVLAVSAPSAKEGNVLVYALAGGAVRSFAAGEHYKWALAVSQDNSELCWLYEVSVEWVEVDPDIDVDRYMNAGFGILSLRDGSSEYTRLLEVEGLPDSVQGFPNQYDSQVAFSCDGERLLLLMSLSGPAGLVSYNRTTRKWHVVATGVSGFVVLP